MLLKFHLLTSNLRFKGGVIIDDNGDVDRIVVVVVLLRVRHINRLVTLSIVKNTRVNIKRTLLKTI